MPRVATEKVQSGMVLGSDVRDISGRMLLKGGTVIAAGHIRVLKTWGVPAIEVEGENGANDASKTVELCDLPDRVVAAIEVEVAQRFQGVDISHPLMVALADIVRADLAAQYSPKRIWVD